MKIILMVVFCLFFGNSFSQQQYNSQNLNWASIKEKAKKNGKYIFVDCYATWCAPCKWMDQNILVDKTVVDYLDKHFITLKVQMDKTPKDDNQIKAWYADAKMLEKDFQVVAFPTYLFFSPDGKIVHRIEGTVPSPKEFIKRAGMSMDAKHQLYGILENIGTNLTDSATLVTAIKSAAEIRKYELADSLAGYFIKLVNDPWSHDNLQIILPVIRYSSGSSFKWLMANSEKVNKQYGRADASEIAISKIIYREYLEALFKDSPERDKQWSVIKSEIAERYRGLPETIWPILFDHYNSQIYRYEVSMPYFKTNEEIDWKAFRGLLQNKYKGVDVDETIAKVMPDYYSAKKQGNKSADAMLKYLRIKKDLSDEKINDLIWNYVFMQADDKNILQKGLKVSDAVIRRNPEETNYQDTYANILYRMGKKDLAIKKEKEAMVSLELLIKRYPEKGSLPSLLDVFRETVAKMEKGERTWRE
ncbi:thioredoxin family protein [Pedobacter sp. PWIIR3]